MTNSPFELVVVCENSLTILARILLVFSRRRITIQQLVCRLETDYWIQISFTASQQQARLLQQQVKKLVEVSSVDLRSLITIEAPATVPAQPL